MDQEELENIPAQQVYSLDDHGQGLYLRTNQIKQTCGLIAYMKHVFGAYNSGIDPQDDPVHPLTPDEWSQQTPTMMRTHLIQNLPDPHGPEPVPSGPTSSSTPKKKIKKLPTRPGYRVFMDICSFMQVSRVGNRHWLIVVDEFSDYTHSFFLKRKSDQIQIVLIWIRILSKKHNIEIKRIRLDNSGENRSLQKECDKANLGITFEFTAPGTPQQNSVAERRMPTLMGRARAMLIQAGIESKYKGEFWCEVISTAKKLDNIMVRPERTNPPPHTLFYGEDAKYTRSLRTFGEMAVIAVIAIHEGKKMRSKFDDRGKTCMFVGYAEDHTKDVYRFLNIHRRRIVLSRDVRWLNIIWKQYKKKSLYARRQVDLFLYEEE